jgi:predicted RNase H-like nuclease (RuvC/YqgF family)
MVVFRFHEQDPIASINLLQDRLNAKTEEIAELKAEVRRLQRSRMLSVEGLPQTGDTVTIPVAELTAMKKDLEVLIP